RPEAATTYDVGRDWLRPSWGPDELWPEYPGFLAPVRSICGQDPQRCQTLGPSRRTAHQVRTRHQPQDGQGAGTDDPAVAAGAGRSGYRVIARRAFVASLTGGLLAAPLAAQAQQRGKLWRIGVLSTADGPEWEAFRQGLRALGYVEGQNVFIEYRWHAGKFENL